MTYAGDVTPAEAFAALTQEPAAVLVDCRSTAEWQFVGIPDLASVSKQVVLVEWQRFPDGSLNARFFDELGAAGVGHDQPVYFMCRSGQRSQAAAVAATAAGYASAFNVAFGFEGGPDLSGHRGTGSGWKAEGLPWRQQ